MPDAETANPEMHLAHDFVRHTARNVFLTGKAGTGKTTFLHRLRNDTPKRMIVTAPTGVAAINAGGVTLHSFFQLPFGPYIPEAEAQRQPEQHRFGKEKIDIIKGLDLLVIDEISMVRADLLDCVDAVLRRFRNHRLPFGGVQLLMIGDLHQLPPVVKEDDWDLLRQYYDSCYFFSSHALRQTDLVSIELKRVYRQSDASFIGLLNRVRDNRLDEDTLRALNSRYLPDFRPGEGEDYITLTTHNRGADRINDQHLQALSAKACTFQADIEGDYPHYSYPTAETLMLKEGAQVMFVRNDPASDKRYFNGKIGKITRITPQGISVQCPGDGAEIPVERVTWENIKYTLDAKTKHITEEVIGKFSQFPLRPAWAITIHKSQGLTFERAIIDAGAAFSHGQVYVALSRCKTFEGLILSTPISRTAVKTDAAVAQFVEQANHNVPTREQLHDARVLYQRQLLLACFDFQPLAAALRKLGAQMRDHGRLARFSGIETLADVERQFFGEITAVAEKFKRQLQSLFEQGGAPEEDGRVQERVQKASRYFSGKLEEGLVKWVSAFRFDTDNKELGKQIDKVFATLSDSLAVKAAALRSCATGFASGAYLNAVARAAIDLAPRAPAKRHAPETGVVDVMHPPLFQALKTWRVRQAQEEGVEHYRILHQRVLIQIAELLPDTPEALLRIKGVGQHTAEKYGDPITAIVRDYCREHGVGAVPRETTLKRASKTDTQQTSYELFAQGKTVSEIAAQRGLTTATIESHLASYVASGQLDLTQMVSPEKIAAIRQAVGDVGMESLKVLKAHLGDVYSYGEIRLVVASLR